MVNPCNNPQSDVLITHLPSVRNPIWRSNIQLQETIIQLAPDVILWHVGLFSFLHQYLKGPPNIPIVGFFSSPSYKFTDLVRLGIGKLIREYKLTALHITASIVPPQVFYSRIIRSGLSGLVVQTNTTRNQLINLGLRPTDVQVIPPGVGEIWHHPPKTFNLDHRQNLGFKPDDVVIAFFGSPGCLRGTMTLVEAFSIAKKRNLSLKLLVLSRRHPRELAKEHNSLTRIIDENRWKEHIKIIDGYLCEEELVGILDVADVIALPFELVPSDAPLSILESVTLGKPIVTTNVACLPEIASPGQHYLAEPADRVSLSQAILQSAQKINPQKPLRCEHPYRSWGEVAEEWKHLILSL